jgi:molybdopterin/thiamine biosynthesis adenylyltransferase
LKINERSSGLIDDFQNKIFHILGCGAIGSSAATQLCRMGVEHFILYDMDVVEVQNIGVSHYVLKDIGKTKVQALEKHLKLINDEVRVHPSHGLFVQFEKPLNDEDIVILGFDSMAARLDAAKVALKGQNKPFLLIDGRMGSEQYQQYILKHPKFKDYLNTWYSDGNASDEPCNAKATSYCSNMSGAFIANAVKKVMNNEEFNSEIIFTFPNNMLVHSAG